MSTYKQITDNILEVQKDPTTIERIALDALDEAMTGNQGLVDPTNPLANLIHMSASMVAASMYSQDMNMRRVYPNMAITRQDLYAHMTDDDYLDVFAEPAKGVILSILIPIDELKEAAITDNNNGNKKIVIGKDTQYVIDEVYFSMNFPIVIIFLPNGGHQVYFDTSIKNPLEPNASNVLDNDVIYMDNIKQLLIKVPVTQYKVDKREDGIANLKGYDKSIPYTDKFYHLRAYYKTNSNTWKPINTTHSGLTYDQTKLTMVISVGDGVIKCRIPEIYNTLNLTASTLRVDILTTKGRYKRKLEGLTGASYTVTWLNYTGVDEEYTAAMSKIRTYAVWSVSDVDGGRDEMPFHILRDKVINGLDDSRAPILERELHKRLEAKGYNVTKLEDHILGSIHLATKSLPYIEEDNKYRVIGSSLESVLYNKASDTYGKTFIKGTNGVTIKPTTLYVRDSRGVHILPDSERELLYNMSSGDRANYLNSNNVLYTPFYTLLDETNSVFDVRSYYLDSPTCISRDFVANNETIGYVVNTRNITMTKLDPIDGLSGYMVNLEVDCPSSLNELYVQLVLRSTNKTQVYVPTTKTDVVDGIAIFNLFIGTEFEITAKEEIRITTVTNDHNQVRTALVGLDCEFDLFYLNALTSKDESSFDSKFIQAIDNLDLSGITHERGVLQFGQQYINYYGEGILKRRPVSVMKHKEDVYETYTSNVYQLDEHGVPIFSIKSDEVVFNILHNKGDYIVDSKGSKILKYRKGTPILDKNGDYIPIKDSWDTLEREYTIPLYSAIYYFSTAREIIKYTNNIPKVIGRYITQELNPLVKDLKERPEVPFSPNNTNTVIEVNDAEGALTRIESQFSIKVMVTLTEDTYPKQSSRDIARDLIMKILVNNISKREVIMSNIYKEIMNEAPNNIIAVEISDFLHTGGYAKILNAADSFSIKSILTLRKNQELDVQTDVEFIYLPQKA